MEGQAGRCPRRLDLVQQLGGFLGTATIFAGHFQQRAAQLRHQPHEDAQLFRGAGFGQQLVELCLAVHHEIGNAVFFESQLRLAGQAHRRHEVADGVREKIFDDLDLAQRGGVEMPDARRPQLLDGDGMGIGLDGIQHIAGKPGQKNVGGGGEFVRIDQVKRLTWPQAFNGLQRRGKARQGFNADGCVHGAMVWGKAAVKARKMASVGPEKYGLAVFRWPRDQK